MRLICLGSAVEHKNLNEAFDSPRRLVQGPELSVGSNRHQTLVPYDSMMKLPVFRRLERSCRHEI